MRYWLDFENRLVEVDDEWRAFALANGAPELATDATFGATVESCCSDRATTEIWVHLLDRARAGHHVRVQIRCDSADCRRLLDLGLATRSGGLVCVSSTLLAQEPRPRVALLESRRPSGGATLKSCSWCRRWRTSFGSWVEVEELIAVDRLLEVSGLPAVSYGICRDCLPKLRRQVSAHPTEPFVVGQL